MAFLESLYTPDDIAKVLQLSKTTVYEMIKKGDLEAHRIGKHLRISSDQLEQYFIRINGFENKYQCIIECTENNYFTFIQDIKIHLPVSKVGAGTLYLSPQDVILSLETCTCSARNQLRGTITQMDLMQDKIALTLNVGFELHVYITAASMNTLNLKLGDTCYAIFKAFSIRVHMD